MSKLCRQVLVGISMLLSAWPASAEWLEAETAHFVVRGDGDERWIRDYARQLELFDQALRYIRKVEDRPELHANRVHVYVLANTAVVSDLCNCRNVAGFYKPRVGNSIAFTPRSAGNGTVNGMGADNVLFHEYTHHFVFQNFPAAYPAWFIEGFAEFNGSAEVRRDGSVSLGRPANYRAGGLARGRTMSVRELMDGTGVRRMAPSDRNAFYARAWVLTHYLTFEQSRAGQLSKYLRLVQGGTASLAAAEQSFGDLRALDSALNAYARSSKLSAYEISAEKLNAGEIKVRRMSAGEAAMMPLAIQSVNRMSPDRALKLLPDARRRAAPFAADAAAQTILADLEFDAGNLAEAEAAADRAIARDPRAVQALLRKGHIRVRQARASRVADPAVWKEARSWFIRANRDDPDFATPLYHFYQSFLIARERPTENALDALERAFFLSPQDGVLRRMAITHYLREDRREDARAALLPLAFDPHQVDPTNRAGRMLELLGAGKSGPETLAALAVAAPSPTGGAD